MRLAISFLVLAGCAPEERTACEELSEGFAQLSARCDAFRPPLSSAAQAADHLFGAPDACERLDEGAFRNVELLTTECVPALAHVECVAEPVLPDACKNQILVTF